MRPGEPSADLLHERDQRRAFRDGRYTRWRLIANLYIDTGQTVHGTALLRDASLLGGATELSLRRKELGVADTEAFEAMSVGGRTGKALFLNAASRKYKMPRIAAMWDTRPKCLVARATNGSWPGPLFPDHRGSQSTKEEVANPPWTGLPPRSRGLAVDKPLPRHRREDDNQAGRHGQTHWERRADRR